MQLGELGDKVEVFVWQHVCRIPREQMADSNGALSVGVGPSHFRLEVGGSGRPVWQERRDGPRAIVILATLSKRQGSKPLRRDDDLEIE